MKSKEQLFCTVRLSTAEPVLEQILGMYGKRQIAKDANHRVLWDNGSDKIKAFSDWIKDALLEQPSAHPEAGQHISSNSQLWNWWIFMLLGIYVCSISKIYIGTEICLDKYAQLRPVSDLPWDSCKCKVYFHCLQGAQYKNGVNRLLIADVIAKWNVTYDMLGHVLEN